MVISSVISMIDRIIMSEIIISLGTFPNMEIQVDVEQ